MTAKVYIDKAKVLEAISEHCDPRYDDIITKIEDGVFDTTPIIEDGYMLVYIEDYNNKTKLLKEKDTEIARLKNGNNKNAEPCDCPHERNSCTYSGYCEHRRAPDKDLNGTWFPTCGLKFPENKIINPKSDNTGDLDDFYEQQKAAARSPNGMA